MGCEQETSSGKTGSSQFSCDSCVLLQELGGCVCGTSLSFLRCQQNLTHIILKLRAYLGKSGWV